MPKPELTAERLRELLHYDPETGVFTRACDSLGGHGTQVIARKGDIAGGICSKWGYRKISVAGHSYRANRLAWLYVTGRWPEGQIDHWNGIRSDDRFDNLRDVSQAVNLQNRRTASPQSISGILGVSPSKKGRWRAQISINNRNRFLGDFDNPQAAHEAYLTAKRKLHEGCTL